MSEEPQINAREFLRHCLATLAYRGGKVLREAPPEFGSFKDAGRTPSEILAHICDLLDWSSSLVRGEGVWRESTPGLWDSDAQRYFDALSALDKLLATPGALECPWKRLLQGPIADALTHIGQLAMLRRMAGSAIRGENYFVAKIVSGRVGSNQPAPRREIE